MMPVLLVEDDEAVAEPLAIALRREGYPVQVCGTAAEALRAISSNSFDLVLLDLGLPDRDGLAVCRDIRAMSEDLPVLMLTARGEEIDIVIGLDAGADDYITKPFRLAELMARIRAMRRRSTPPASLEVEGLRIDAGARRASAAGVDLTLTAKEFELLQLLARNMGTVVGRAEIAREIWSGAVEESARTIDTHISALRRALADNPASGLQVLTARRVGFRLARS